MLDVEGTSADLGKTAGKDAAAGKPTYPALFGLERSKALAADARARARAALDAAHLGGHLGRLADLVRRRDAREDARSTRCSSRAAWPRRASGRGR